MTTLELMGSSRKLAAILEDIKAVAATDCAVLIQGETGVRTLADADRAHIISVLRETNWTVGGPHGAAARLGLFRTTLLAKMRKLGIARDPARQCSQCPESASLFHHAPSMAKPLHLTS
jgi:transcriptional regulator with GAF, ATPase, and Fis domain